jgi:hypothetical protein
MNAKVGWQTKGLDSNGDSTYSTYFDTPSSYCPKCGKGPEGMLSSCTTNMTIGIGYERQNNRPVFKDNEPKNIFFDFQTGKVSLY